MFTSGRSNHGVLLRLNAEASNSRFTRSVIRNLRTREKSILNRWGPARIFRPTLPNVRGAGLANDDVENQYCPGPVCPRICTGAIRLGRFVRPLAFRLVALVTISRGSPLSHVQRPVSCQPPATIFAGPLRAPFFPGPNGSS